MHVISLTNSGNKFRNIKCQTNENTPAKIGEPNINRSVKNSFLKYSFTISFPPNIKNCAIVRCVAIIPFAYGNKNVFIVDYKRSWLC